MKFSKIIKSISTKTDLKRFCSAYVVDYRNLQEEEVLPALEKTAPQYYHRANIEKSWTNILLNEKRNVRIIGYIFISKVLLNCDDFMCEVKDTESLVASFEQKVVDAANEGVLPKKGEYVEALDQLSFLLGVAWDHNDDISRDEQNLINKVRCKLNITEYDAFLLEAKMGKFPQVGNVPHLRGDVDTVRRELQNLGLVVSVKDDEGKVFDVIPEEVAGVLRSILGLEVNRYGYKELLKYKAVRRKDVLIRCLSKAGYVAIGNETLEELKFLVIERVKPSVVLGGVTPRDGLSNDELSEWCKDFGAKHTGTKGEMIDGILSVYDNLRFRDQDVEDERVHWYGVFEQLASRERDYLRQQQIVDKDIEIERKFEDATRYLFQVKLGHQPLKQVGNEHADGMLSYEDELILWDNKSKETEVNLGDHVSQFERYLKLADRKVAGFVVVGPSFTSESSGVAMKFKVENKVTMTLVTATQLKELAEDWYNGSGDKGKSSFPLGYLIQQGVFSRSDVYI